MATANALFAILAVSNASAIEAKLAQLTPWLYLKVAEGQWLVVAPTATTTKELSDKLGITASDSTGTGIVLRVENYFGRTAASTWEWISAKMGASLGITTGSLL